MKIKCNDGVVRDFEPAKEDFRHSIESRCKHCGAKLGCNDTKFAKQTWKEHTCRRDE